MLRRLTMVGIVAAVVYAVIRYLQGPRTSAFDAPPTPAAPGGRPSSDGAATPSTAAGRATAPLDPDPAPSPRPDPAEAPVIPADDTEAWVAPSGGTCPITHPVKANLSSGIFHLPGGLSYDRTSPDRCYANRDAAEADGLRASKR